MGLMAARMLGRLPLVLDRLGTGPAAPEARVPAALLLMVGGLIRHALTGLCWSGGEPLDALARLLSPAPTPRMHALPTSSAAPAASAPHRLPAYRNIWAVRIMAAQDSYKLAPPAVLILQQGQSNPIHGGNIVCQWAATDEPSCLRHTRAASESRAECRACVAVGSMLSRAEVLLRRRKHGGRRAVVLRVQGVGLSQLAVGEVVGRGRCAAIRSVLFPLALCRDSLPLILRILLNMDHVKVCRLL